MNQAAFVLTPPPEKRPHKIVRSTSVLAYEYVRETAEGQRAVVLQGLAGFWNRHQRSPEASEVAQWIRQHGTWTHWCHKCVELTVRRRLSDLQKQRITESLKDGARLRWRVIERGTGPTP